MKIALDAKKAFNNTAGLGQYARTLINGLTQQFPKNEYSLYTSKIKQSLKNQIEEPYTLLQPTTLFHKAIPSIWRTFSVSEALKEVDLVHGLSNELPLSIHKLPIKKIVTIHDVIYLKHKEQYKPIDQWLYHYKTAYAVKHADKIISISEETKHDLIHFYNVPATKIEVIYQSCNPTFTLEINPNQRQLIKKKYSLPDNYILNVSSFYPRKNHQKMLEAFALIKDKTNFDMVFVGDQGSERGSITSLIQKLGLTNRVHILSNVTNDDMPAVYQQASLFLYPSLFEGFGIPILEALCSKVPVITTKGGCFEEVGGAKSCYVNPTDATEIAENCMRILDNPTLQKSMIHDGMLHASSISEANFIKSTMSVYESL